MGATYATKQSFAGQRASVGRVVLIMCARHDDRPGKCLRAGMIVAVSSTKDLPWILDVKHPELGPTTEMQFLGTMTAEEAEQMPVSSWTWPPRL